MAKGRVDRRTARERIRRWRAKHPDRVQVYGRFYYQKHRKARLAYQRAYSKTPAGARARDKYRDKHLLAFLMYMSLYNYMLRDAA